MIYPMWPARLQTWARARSICVTKAITSEKILRHLSLRKPPNVITSYSIHYTKLYDLVTNKSQEFSTAWERGTHKYTDYLHKQDINFIAYSADHPEVFLPLHEFTGVLMNQFYQPIWHEGSTSSFEDLEQRLDQYMKHYNYVSYNFV